MLARTLSVLFLSLLFSDAMWACDCVPAPLETELEQVDQVFQGRVLAINDRQYPVTYEFEVLYTWKGKRRRKVTVSSGMGAGDCGYPFELGKMYLVFVKRGRTSQCRRTAPIDRTPDVALLSWKRNGPYRRTLQRSKAGPLTKLEAYHLGHLLLVAPDSLTGKRVAFFDGSFLVSKREFFRTWGGHEADINYLRLDEADRRRYGVDYMVVAWGDGEIVDSEKEVLLEKYKRVHTPDERTEKRSAPPVLSRKD